MTSVMQIRVYLANAAHAIPPVRILSAPFSIRRHSSALSNLHHELTSRPLSITYDYMSPTPSHLLTTSLSDLFANEKFLESSSLIPEKLPYVYHRETGHLPVPLPKGHHSVYFPTAVPQHALLPDGTDSLHSPPTPTSFTRRLWAGGSLKFNRINDSSLYLDGTRAVCIEAIKDVLIRGPQGHEKVFVHIERKIAHVFPLISGERQFDDAYIDEQCIIQRLSGGEAAVIERRELVFIRGSEKDPTKIPVNSKERVIKSSHNPDFSTCLTVTPSLLFRFSALTFNAHAIHLNPEYSREVEGHRNLLVHGPLTLILMLSALHRQLEKGEEVESFTYRNLAPLYAQEEIRVCVRRDREKAEKFEVWVEGGSGGYAVKGSAIINRTEFKQGDETKSGPRILHKAVY